MMGANINVIDSKPFQFDERDFDLRELLANIERHFAKVAGAEGVGVVMKVSEQTPHV